MNTTQEKVFFSPVPSLFSSLFNEPYWKVLDLIETFFDTLQFKQEESPKNAYLENRALIHISKGCVIEPGAYIKGPVFLGPNTVVRHGAYIRPFSIFMENNMIGHASEIKHSILFPHANAPHFNYVGDSILGNRVNLGAGSIVSNFRLDKKSIRIHFFDEMIDTQRQKFGAIIGDDVQIGANSILNPGTIIGPKAHVYPGSQLSGFYPPKSVIKSNET